jgi:Lrp/AsnC family leucine-responsive transcriptional regulator
MIPKELDECDQRLLTALASDGRATVASLAKLVGLSGPSVHDRLRKLEATGVIRGYAALIDPEAADGETAAFVAMNMGPGAHDKAAIDALLANEPTILEAHEIAGEDCFLLKMRVKSSKDLSAAVGRLRQIGPGVTTRTTVVLRTAFERPLLASRSSHDDRDD